MAIDLGERPAWVAYGPLHPARLKASRAVSFTDWFTELASELGFYGSSGTGTLTQSTRRSRLRLGHASVAFGLDRLGQDPVAPVGALGSPVAADNFRREIRRIFEINVFGLSDVTRAVLPAMRQQRSGMIVNFSSIGGLRSFPAVGYYNATKFAVEGLSEALWLETEPLGIKVMLVEPGPFRTDWAGRSADETRPEHEIADYASTAGANRAGLRSGSGNEPGDPFRASQAIITAVNATNPPHRLLLGHPAYDMAMVKLDELRDEFTAWENVSRNADFPAGE
jgi:short chain dehydrogenase